MKTLRILLVGGLLVLAAFVLPAQTTQKSQEVVDLTGSTASVKEITVMNDGYTFIPSEITVNLGDTVRITFQNTGGVHDWVLDEFNVATPVFRGKKSETVEFVADKVGTFEYYCSVANHRALGMWGTFIVKD